MKVMKFEEQDLPDINQYAAIAEQYIPGRRAIFSIVEASFLELVGDGRAKILVVGAGGGEEILRLGLDNPSWSFVGVDTSEPMVDLARRRLAETPVGPRSDVHAMPIEKLDASGFDAATCILTAHFVPDDGSKHAFFKAIRARLKPGAPLAVVDGVSVSGEARTELLRRIWKRHCPQWRKRGAAEGNSQNFKKVAVVSAERQEELLTGAGFKDLMPIFRGITIKGWLAFA